MSEPPVDTDSILLTVKQLLGLPTDYHAFDLDIVTHINSVFMTLHQLGVGPAQGFMITGEEDQWRSFADETMNVAAIRTYIFLKVRLMFDPPTNSFTITAFEKMATEMEWRLNVQVDTEPLITP